MDNFRQATNNFPPRGAPDLDKAQKYPPTTLRMDTILQVFLFTDEALQRVNHLPGAFCGFVHPQGYGRCQFKTNGRDQRFHLGVLS